MESATYEQKLEAVKALIAELGKSDLPLDKAVGIFKEARKLLDEAGKMLETAEAEYEELQSGEQS
ncbi:MAG: exodeoxyribonuclease VII small subunit [Helicobacteraceae bacterium]|jgi:exodeoxyribonuclease VII small subunit|nr:exodeoxyribonuclease VII small subunit [Helicobacteraceae bacterium]